MRTFQKEPSAFRGKIGQLWRAALPRFGRTIDLGRYAERWCVPPATSEPAGIDVPAELNSQVLDLRIQEQLTRLARWRSREYQELFTVLRRNPRINENGNENFIGNGFYPTPDAECYAATILEQRPTQIVEVGSGYSTRIARAAIDFGGLKTVLRVIDPEPRAEIHADVDEVIRYPVEQVPRDQLDLTGDSILFIDSSHICRARGDLPFLYCKILPGAPRGLLIHVHDIYLPYEYPAIYDRWLWNEQYVLFALLAHSTKFEILLTTYYLSRHHAASMRATISPTISAQERTGGCFWFRACK